MGLNKIFAGKGLKKYSIIQFINTSLKNNLWVPYVDDVQGNKMYLLKGGDCTQLATFGIYEPFETEILKKEIKKGDFVVDVGASVGYYTLLFAKWVGNKGKVFSFEPIPNKFSVLKKNVQINNYHNVMLVQKHVSNKSILNSDINSITLDDYFDHYNNQINLIKMDIEGSEGLALDGMKKFLEKNKNIKILTEFHTSELKKFGVEPQDFLQTLDHLGFSIYNINEKNKKLENINCKEFLKNYPQNEIFTNLFCSRE